MYNRKNKYNEINEIEKQKKSVSASKNKVSASVVLFSLFLALVVGCFIGNSLFYSTQPTQVKHWQRETPKQNFNSSIALDMSPRKVSVEKKATTFDEIAPKVSVCVVGINAVGKNFSAVGSGVAVANGGYILTNQHVIDDAQDVSVLLASGESARAKVLWQDSALDLAIIKSGKNMPWLEIGAENDAVVGEPIMAVGTPLSLQFQHSHTAGIISALNRNIAVQGGDGEIYVQNYIQHDASINPGNSGGPAISLDGKIIGINTLKITEAEGIGFAIPAYIVNPILKHVVENGEYNTAYLGFYGFDSVIARYYGANLEVDGVVIKKIDKDGPLAKAGAKINDVITHVGDNKINSMLELRLALYDYMVGDDVKITLLCDSGEKEVQLKLASHPNAM